MKTKHIYLCRVDKYIGAYNPHTGEVVGYKEANKFVDFVQEILDKFPEYSPHNVRNYGIEREIFNKIIADRKRAEYLKRSR